MDGCDARSLAPTSPDGGVRAKIMGLVTYQELIERFGAKMAYALLRVIEKNTNIGEGRICPINRNVRLQRALRNLDKQSLRAA